MNMPFDERLTAYRLAMCLAAEMLQRNIISCRDYEQIGEIMANKYSLSSASIYR